ncbi:neurofilament heavy polypeptide isoform X4 [Dermacentor albipictus]|uniref:neurofilament heavy polypeptide isoform X4 n=1 Tax=Dermacentor albipictus TaxID=60249 RepID=UPI0038FC6977
MINTFWNLCRACPIPAESKLHAEYKRSFAWQPGHLEPAGNVVVKPPDATSLEPTLTRKKKHPEVAYRTSDILGTDGSHHQAAATGSADALHRDDNDHCYRARPGERSNKSKVGSRSRSADPSLGRGRPVMSHGDEAPCKTSEYRAAFAWPPKPSLPPATRDVVDGPHRAEPTERLLPRDDTSHEVKKTTKRTEYKAKYKPFSSYMYVDGSWKKPKATTSEAPPVVDPNQWYTEVVERLHMADEYRIRSRAGALQTAGATALHGTTLWAKLDSSASLAALALAHTPRLGSARMPPRERPAPASVHRSQSAKRREKTDAEAGRTTDTSEKKSPTKAVSPVKAEAGNQRKASSAAKTAAAARQKQTSPKAPVKHDDDGAKTPTSSRTRAASSPPQRRTPLAEADKKDDKKTGASRPRRPLQESAAPPAAKPRAVVRPASAAVNEQDGKIWLKPQGKPEGEEAVGKEHEGTGKAEDAGGGEDGVLVPPATTPAESVEAATPGSGSERKSDAVRPSSLPPMNGSSASSSALASADMASPSPLPEPQSGPVPLTTVKSPEEVTGVKSPDPETWTVPLDTGRGLEWTDGQSPAGDWPGKAKSTTAPIIDTAPKPTPAPKMESTIPEGKVDPIPKAAPEESPHKAASEDPVKPQPAGQAGVDVLDKARNRLEEFWVTGK